MKHPSGGRSAGHPTLSTKKVALNDATLCMVNREGPTCENNHRIVTEPLSDIPWLGRDYAAVPYSPVATMMARASTASRIIKPNTAGVASGSMSIRSTSSACTTNQ